MWRILKFLQIWQHFWFLHVCCVKNLEFLHKYWNLKFLHMIIFSPSMYRWSMWQIWGMLQLWPFTTCSSSILRYFGILLIVEDIREDGLILRCYLPLHGQSPPRQFDLWSFYLFIRSAISWASVFLNLSRFPMMWLANLPCKDLGDLSWQMPRDCISFHHSLNPFWQE